MRAVIVDIGPAARGREASRSIEELYVRHVPAARVTAYLLTGDRSAAEDLAHEAFLRVIGRFHHLRAAGSFHAYLRRTVVNLSLNHLRRRRTERAYVERERGAGLRTADLPDVGLRDELWRALLELPPRRRAALVLRFYEDLPEREVGEILGCSPSAIRSLVAHGMQTLRARIRGEDE